MEAWASWAIFLVIAGAAYWYYTQNNKAIARGRSTTRLPTASSLKDNASWTESEKKPKAAPKATKAKAPRKSVKTAVQEVGNKVEAALSTATSPVDADDDSSPAVTPAATSSKGPSGKDVSDMLGSQSAAPSVLSIKPTEKTGRAAKPQLQKTESTQESKKQRQNRRKVEEAKIAREAEEKERQSLLEKQRRTAREARGEPAKNGVQQAKAPSNNPWTTVSSRGAVQPPVPSSGGLLDTFEAASTGSVSDAPTNGTAQTAASYNSLPSEAEQLRLAMEESAWTTVPKGGKKTRKTVNEELAEEGGNDFGVVQAQQPVKPVQPVVRPTQAMKAENQKPSSRYQILSEEFTTSHKDDSDWPVV